MPIPSPHKSESKQTFVSRCMGDSVMNHEYGDQKQRAAICYHQWSSHKAKAAYVIQAAGDEFVVEAKQPIDSDIKKRERRAGDPPEDALPNPEKGGPSSSTNPDLSNAPSPDLPQRGSKNQERLTTRRQKADSLDDSGAKPALDSMQWQMGTLEAEEDPETGLAKWPLSFKRIEKDVKRPNKPGSPNQKPATDKKDNDQPPTCV